MHIDQNEKLVMYGATRVLAIDGYSGFILGLITMPVKNNLIIYDQLFRPILLNFGLWEQIRADHGREFFLLLYVQEHLTHLRRNQRRAPHVQSSKVWIHDDRDVRAAQRNEFPSFVDGHHLQWCRLGFCIRLQRN